MVYKYVSIKNVMEGIYRDNAISEEVNFLDCVEWAGESLEAIGAYSQFQQKTAEAELCDYRIELPCDFHRLLGISFGQWPLHEASSQYGNLRPSNAEVPAEMVVNNAPVNLPQSVPTAPCDNFYTYTINNNFIYTNIKSGTLTISYLAIPTDCDGFPLIPDNYYYLKAIKSYINYMLDRIQWRMGQLPDRVYYESKEDWQWYTRSASSAGMMPNIDGMENFKNSWLRLYPQINQYNSFFRNLATQERLGRHNSNGSRSNI